MFCIFLFNKVRNMTEICGEFDHFILITFNNYWEKSILKIECTLCY
jgi:hypothetical protein